MNKSKIAQFEQIGESTMYTIGVVLSSEKITAAIYSKEYTQIAVCEATYKDDVTVATAELCKALMADNGIKAEDVEYIGAAVCEELECPACIASELEKETGIKTAAESIIKAEALGEAYLSNDESSIILIKINDTVESGIVIDKKIYPGSVAHTVINFGGYECSCGRKGCFEAYASNAGLRRIAAEAGVKNAESITVTQLYAMNDDAAETAKKIYADIIANAVTNVINLFQTHELVLEGEFTKVGDVLMKPIMEIILRDQYTKLSPIKCNVRIANTEANTALMGAALILR